MNYPIWIIWKAMYLPFLGLKDRENGIRGRTIGLIAKHYMKLLKIAFAVEIMSPDARLMALSFSGTSVSLPEILQADDLVV